MRLTDKSNQRLEEIAEGGSPHTKFLVGHEFEKRKENDRAFFWVESASHCGVIEATYREALYFLKGIGIRKSKGEAKLCFKRAAAKGHPRALKWCQRHEVFVERVLKSDGAPPENP